jgi:predicted nucleic acid-binding protein
MNTYFLDTAYLPALELKGDQNHEAATEHWQEVKLDLPLFVTTSYVFDEVVTYFNSRRLHAKAVQVGNALLFSPSVRFVHVDEALFEEGWAYFQQHRDKEYSPTDCISFVRMKKYGIQTAFTFDRHFAQAGFNKEP